MITPYLSFSGECESAFKFYETVFEGKIEHMVRYGDSLDNAAASISEDQRKQIMHAQVKLTETGRISGADAVWPIENGSMVSIHVHMPSEKRAHEVFSGLSEGATVLGELKPNPPPDDNGLSGMLKDKFGFTWIISCLKD